MGDMQRDTTGDGRGASDGRDREDDRWRLISRILVLEAMVDMLQAKIAKLEEWKNPAFGR